MKSGMLAAEAAFDALTSATSSAPADLAPYEAALKASWVWEELERERNIRPACAVGHILDQHYRSWHICCSKEDQEDAAESLHGCIEPLKPASCFCGRLSELRCFLYWTHISCLLGSKICILFYCPVVHRFKYGLWPGMALSAVDTVLLRGKAPWTLRHRQVTRQAPPAYATVCVP